MRVRVRSGESFSTVKSREVFFSLLDKIIAAFKVSHKWFQHSTLGRKRCVCSLKTGQLSPALFMLDVACSVFGCVAALLS